MPCDDQKDRGPCGAVMVERMRYFTGRHMTARDFHDEDAYHRTFRRLHNRMLHGWGIVCGLTVHRQPHEECGVIVRCGLALDCCGHEIMVRKDAVLKPPVDEWPRRVDMPCRDRDYVLLLCLEYCESLTEKVPVLYSPQACSSPAYEYGRIKEGYALRWHFVREDKLENYGWFPPHGCPPPDPDDLQGGPDACEDSHKEPRCCLEPECPEHHCVPLAVLRSAEDEQAPLHVDERGRRHTGPSRDALTHVCWISWPHGGIVRTSDMRELMVRFDRPILPAEHPRRPGPRGISERTFVVQYGEQREDLDFVTFRRRPHLLPDRRTAVYEVDDPHIYRDHVVQVTLRCDFILDCHHQPVDGNHLRGHLPSGDGVPGGTFESWFRVVRDSEYEDALRETVDEELDK